MRKLRLAQQVCHVRTCAQDNLWPQIQVFIRADGTLWCWGSDDSRQVGDGSSEARLSPTRIRGQGWAMVSAGVYDTCGTPQNGSLWCWGGNADGQLGDGMTDAKRTPEQTGTHARKAVHACANATGPAGARQASRLGRRRAVRSPRPRR